MSDQRNGQQQDYEYFPFKSYEALQEERRRASLRHSAVITTALLLLIAAIAVGTGLAVGRSPLDFLDDRDGASTEQLAATPETGAASLILDRAQGLSAQSATRQQNTEKKQASKSEAAVQPQTAELTEAKDSAIVVMDISGMVAKARASVVGITTETYSNFSTTSSGSGIILSEDGYIVTNNHVIRQGNSISVTLDSGESYPAYVIGADEFTDIAVLKVAAENLKAAELGDSDALEPGQAAVAIGNPTGQLLGTVTAGIISGVNRDVVVNNVVMSLIQTDAAINAGNSGGPLLNQYGQVVGVTSVKVSMSGYEGLGFAIPINSVIPIVEELVQNGYVSGRPLVGMRVQAISFMASRFYSLPQGLYISEIDPTCDAYHCGIRAGDLITAIDGTDVSTLSEACTLRNMHAAGETMTLTVYRKGTLYQVEVQLGEQTEGNSYSF